MVMQWLDDDALPYVITIGKAEGRVGGFAVFVPKHLHCCTADGALLPFLHTQTAVIS